MGYPQGARLFTCCISRCISSWQPERDEAACDDAVRWHFALSVLRACRLSMRSLWILEAFCCLGDVSSHQQPVATPQHHTKVQIAR